jgi:predicted AlkP superfamily pyrophosphatase or phosphodiesterase
MIKNSQFIIFVFSFFKKLKNFMKRALAVADVEKEHFLHYFSLNVDLLCTWAGMSGIYYFTGKTVTLIAYFQALIIVSPNKFRAARPIFLPWGRFRVYNGQLHIALDFEAMKR